MFLAAEGSAPAEPKFALASALCSDHFHRQILSACVDGPLFFNIWPLRSFPTTDGFLIPFYRPAFRTLATETQRTQDSPHMARMVAHPSQVFDQIRHPGQGP